jgi:hypothetical protein
MKATLQAFLTLGVCLVCVRAAAQEQTDDRSSEDPFAAQPTAQPPQPPPPAAVAEVKPAAEPPSAWHAEVNGYFRAPMALGISQRPGPDNMTGPNATQVSYGPNRTVDASYYSFAYTRLQEQDWAEVFVHARKPHVDAAVGWMGFWFQAVGFRNYDAAWAPGLAYVALDTDFKAAGLTPNIAFTAGAWWPRFGYFEKYDTYTLGRYRQLGTQLKLTVPFSPDYTVIVTPGFGTSRDGTFNTGGPPLYGATTSLDLVTYVNVQVIFKKILDAALHYSTQWTADPNLPTSQDSAPGPKSFMAAQAAHLTVLGGEANLRLPVFGHFWISPSYIHVRNGWALASGGTEVMHALGGAGIAANYMAFHNTPTNSTGSGSMFNLGFLYENTLSNVQGKPAGTLPDLTLSIFGLLADASLDLPSGSMIMQNSIKQFKYGADLTLQSTTWFGFMLRYDLVNYDLDHPGIIFAAVTGRAIISSHFLSSERIYVQFSRYRYGDKMVLAGTWPWGAPYASGNDVLQGGAYAGLKPDENVVKVQADIAF